MNINLACELKSPRAQELRNMEQLSRLGELVVRDKYSIADDLSLTHVMRRPAAEAEEGTPVVALVVTERRAKELRDRCAPPRYLAKRNPHSSMSIRHHVW